MSTIRVTDFSVNLLQSILWQYDNAPNLLSLVNSKQEWYDINQEGFWREWFNNVFYLYNPLPSSNPFAFNSFGAPVWSILLQVPLQIGFPPDPDDAIIFEFDQDGHNFDNSAFSNQSGAIRLDIDDATLLLRLRYYQLVTNGAIGTLPPNSNNPNPVPGIADFIIYVFGLYPKYNGLITVIDDYNMQMTYLFSEAIPYSLQFILNNYDILPRPAGVKINIVTSTDLVFSFDNPYNFDNGAFVKEIK